MDSIASHRELLEQVLPVTRAAGRAILEVYATDFEVRDKSDTSPVTAADERAEAIILAALAKLTPSIPVVSEEAAAAGRTPAVAERFWLVDPLDGTKEFINRNGEFTVNIALIENGYPALGVVLAPAQSRLFAGA
jgi:3'(2'), 5'-bisphosphate nucleotidase